MNLFNVRVSIYSFLLGIITCLLTILFTSTDMTAKITCVFGPAMIILAMALEWWERKKHDNSSGSSGDSNQTAA